MQSLLERVQSKQAPTGEPVTLAPRIGAGRLVRYMVRPGQRVEKDATIARVLDAGGLPVDVAAPFSGEVASLPFQQGECFPVGAAIAYLISDAPQARQRPAPVAPAPTVAAIAKTPQRATGEASEPVEQPAPLPIAPPAPPRRSTMPPALELTILEPEEEPALELVKPTKKKTKNRTYTLGSHQEASIARLAHELNGLALDGKGKGVNESELVRAAVRMLLDLPRPALIAMIDANKAQEKQEGWGTGRPRPGRGSKRA